VEGWRDEKLTCDCDTKKSGAAKGRPRLGILYTSGVTIRRDALAV
jgi:hypothetical protein